MNFLKTISVTAVSFILGAVLFHTPIANATPQASGSVAVFINTVWMDNAKLPAIKVIPGSRVAGISCIPKPLPKLPDAAVCYVATDNTP